MQHLDLHTPILPRNSRRLATPHLLDQHALGESLMSTPASLPYAFVAKIVAADGQHDAVADLLAGAVALANEEVGTIVWFAVRTDADTFWIFDAFPDEAARDAHANGAIVAALMANQHLLGAAPEILAADVLASKLP